MRRPGVTGDETAMTTTNGEIDQVTLSVIHNHLDNICREMGIAMMKTSYSTIFNEGLDFSCVIFNRKGDMIAPGGVLSRAAWRHPVRHQVGDRGVRSGELRAGRRGGPQRPLPRRVPYARTRRDQAGLLRRRAFRLRRQHRSPGRDSEGWLQAPSPQPPRTSTRRGCGCPW